MMVRGDLTLSFSVHRIRDFSTIFGVQALRADGGRLIFMDATNFLAEVRFYSQTNHLALVKGHGWGLTERKSGMICASGGPKTVLTG